MTPAEAEAEARRIVGKQDLEPPDREETVSRIQAKLMGKPSPVPPMVDNSPEGLEAAETARLLRQE